MVRKRLESLKDLSGICGVQDILTYQVKDDRIVILKKENDKITAVSPNKYNLQDKAKRAIKSISSKLKDFEVEGFLNKSGKIFIYDVLQFHGKDINLMNYRARLNLVDDLLSEDIQKIEIKKVTSFDDLLIGKNIVIVDDKAKRLINRFEYDSNKNTRKVILSDYYYGNKIENKREVLFKCYQLSNKRSVYVGKIRIFDDEIRRKVMKTIDKKKRLIAYVQIDFDKKNSSKFSKISFIGLLRDEKFNNVIVDKDLFFKPIIIFSRFAKSKSSYYLVKDQKNLNTVSGAI